MPIRSVLIFLAVLFFTVNYSLSAQTTSHYQSKATYDRNSKELIKRLKHHLSDEFTAEETSETIKKINLARLRYLTMLVEDKWFIEDQALETYVNDIMSRLVDANELEERQRTVLVMRTHSVNATNYGKGIFFVTLGMLATIKTEDELAFALAHEIAHDELTHIRHNILRRAEAEKK